jgi:glutaredoxin 3
MKSVTLYTTEMCPYCVAAKALLSKRGIAYDEINLSRDPDSRKHLVNITGMTTFPQIVIDGEAIGGFNELRDAASSGRLTELLTA